MAAAGTSRACMYAARESTGLSAVVRVFVAPSASPAGRAVWEWIWVEIVTLPGREDLNHYLARHEIGAFQKLLPRHAPTQPVKATDCRYTAQGVILHQGSRRSVPAQQASSHRCPYLSLSQTKTSHGSSFEVHHGSRHAPGGRRSVHDCVVARAPTPADHANLSRHHARDERKALDKVTPHQGRPTRYRPDDRLLSFLKNL